MFLSIWLVSWILGWLVYGLLVGYVAKYLHPGDDPGGILATLGIGVGGSFVGGFLAWMIGLGASPFSASGVIFGVLGGVVCCALYRVIRMATDAKLTDKIEEEESK